MTRHSKQHAEIVSNHESRRAINSWYDNHWGTQTVREGAQAVLDFDSCRICMHHAVSPVCCPKGYLYCKECIYKFLMQKKLKYKEELDKYNEQQTKQQARLQKEEHEDRLKPVLEFERIEESAHSTEARVGQKRKAGEAPLGYEAYKGDKGTIFLTNKALVSKHGSCTLGKEEKEIKKQYLPCFWIPSMTASHVNALLPEPKEDSTDAYGNELKRKQLKDVHFTQTPDHDAKMKSEKGRWMCPISRKTLTNTTLMCFIKDTGDVVTEEVANIIRKDGLYKDQKIKAKNIIKFNAGGSGFAGGGAKKVSSTVTPVFLA